MLFLDRAAILRPARRSNSDDDDRADTDDDTDLSAVCDITSMSIRLLKGVSIVLYCACIFVSNVTKRKHLTLVLI